MICDFGMDSFPGYLVLIYVQFNLCFVNTATVYPVKSNYLVSTVNHLLLTDTFVRIPYGICIAAVFVIINDNDSLVTLCSIERTQY